MSIPAHLKKQNKLYDLRKKDSVSDSQQVKKIIMDKIILRIFYPEKLLSLSKNIKNVIDKQKTIECNIYSYDILEKIKIQKINEYFFIIGFSGYNFSFTNGFKYFLYQLEQINTQQKINNILTEQNKKLIENSIVTFDYSLLNMKYYPEYLKEKIKILLPPLKLEINQSELINYKSKHQDQYKYDILFYGTLTIRRTKIMEELNRFFKTKYVSNVYGKELENLIKESKICLNLHYYDDSIFESVRIHELLSYNSIILSEYPCKEDMENIQPYTNNVIFVEKIKEDLSNMFILINRVIDILNNYDFYKNNTERNEIIKFLSKDCEETYNQINSLFFISKYKYLFHKYVVEEAKLSNTINYYIIKDNKTNSFIHNKLYAHLHCYNIEMFEKIYGKYINIINYFFKIIVTYSIGYIEKVRLLQNSNFVVLKIINKGLDIGAKFTMVKYLNDNNIEFDYIFFLHSKTDVEKRHYYFKPFINFLSLKKQKNENINELYNYDGWFPNQKWEIIDNVIKGYDGTIWPERNLLYKNELLKFLNCEKRENIFFEGNVYILSNNVVNKVFTNIHIYNMLNNGNLEDFDYNWILKTYLYNQGIIYNIKISEAYNIYKENIINKDTKNKNKDIKKFDGCIEHTFERSITSFCNSYKELQFYNSCCILFYIHNMEECNNILKKYNKLFYNSIYTKYIKVKIIVFEESILNSIKNNKILKNKEIVYIPEIKEAIYTFSEELITINKNNNDYDVKYMYKKILYSIEIKKSIEAFLNNINNMIKDAKQYYDIVSVIDTLSLKMFNNKEILDDLYINIHKYIFKYSNNN